MAAEEVFVKEGYVRVRLWGLPIIFGLMFTVMFIVPALLYEPPLVITLSRGVIEQFDSSAIWAGVACSFVWSAAFMLVAWTGTRQDTQELPMTYEFGKLRRTFYWLAYGGIAATLFRQVFSWPASIQAYVHLLGLLPLFALAAGRIILAAYPTQISRGTRYSIYIALTLTLVAFGGFGLLLGNVIWVVIAAVCMLWLSHALGDSLKRQAITAVLVLIVLGAGILGKNHIRETVFRGPYQPLPLATLIDIVTPRDGYVERLQHTLKQTRHDIRVEGRERPPRSMESLLATWKIVDPNMGTLRIPIANEEARYFMAMGIGRVSHLGSLLIVKRNTPAHIPYSGLATYEPVFWLVVPRIIFPNKPVNTLGHDFGVRYGYLSESDNTTSVNMDVVSEAWASGGWMMIVLSALAVGAVVFAVLRIASLAKDGLATAFAGTVIAITLPTVESGAAFMIGGLVHASVLAAALWVLFRTMARPARKSP